MLDRVNSTGRKKELRGVDWNIEERFFDCASLGMDGVQSRSSAEGGEEGVGEAADAGGAGGIGDGGGLRGVKILGGFGAAS